ncbi:MAG: hypothetical protein WCJ59_01560 [bacterium]
MGTLNWRDDGENINAGKKKPHLHRQQEAEEKTHGICLKEDGVKCVNGCHVRCRQCHRPKKSKPAGVVL